MPVTDCKLLEVYGDTIFTRLKSEIADLKKAGIGSDRKLAADAKATAMKLDGDDGDEYWVGLHNFYVITRYNHSHLYAMAVAELAEAIKQQAEAEHD